MREKKKKTLSVTEDESEIESRVVEETFLLSTRRVFLLSDEARNVEMIDVRRDLDARISLSTILITFLFVSNYHMKFHLKIKKKIKSG